MLIHIWSGSDTVNPSNWIPLISTESAGNVAGLIQSFHVMSNIHFTFQIFKEHKTPSTPVKCDTVMLAYYCVCICFRVRFTDINELYSGYGKEYCPILTKLIWEISICMCRTLHMIVSILFTIGLPLYTPSFKSESNTSVCSIFPFSFHISFIYSSVTWHTGNCDIISMIR